MLDNMTTGEKVIAGATALGIAALVFHKPTRNAVGLSDGRKKKSIKGLSQGPHSLPDFYDYYDNYDDSDFNNRLAVDDRLKIDIADAKKALSKAKYEALMKEYDKNKLRYVKIVDIDKNGITLSASNKSKKIKIPTNAISKIWSVKV